MISVPLQRDTEIVNANMDGYDLLIRNFSSQFLLYH
jgi:hypothetical protein